MSSFADLTPHTYTPTDGATVLNVGWLGAGHRFGRGETSAEFREALRLLCQRPIRTHRGFHQCEFCPAEVRRLQPARFGNGQVRIMGADLIWYAAPTLVHHYVVAHEYLPPAAFVEAVLHPLAVAEGGE